jgi:hypothetical protein
VLAPIWISWGLLIMLGSLIFMGFLVYKMHKRRSK